MKFTNISIFAITLLIINTSTAQKNNDADINNGIARPKLVVGLVIDQMRWDYLYRYYNRYSEGGFKRLLKSGYSFENTHIPYTPTVTAAGHTCIYTGSVPALHGVVGNNWVENTTGENMYCTQDKTVKTIGSFSTAGQMSPRNMLTTTIGDELRIGTNFKSRVFGVALKDRGAILPAGHSANAAYWFDDSTANWITSTYYKMDSLPKWVQDFNGEKKADAYIKKGWNLLYPISKYDASTKDDVPYERFISGEKTVTFPHNFTSNGGKNYGSVRTSPFGNSISFDFAKQLIIAENLGTTGQTDMLCISLSSTDYIGHTFGPQSVEVEDCYLRLDKDLENFLNTLDKTYGKNNYLLFLSADHGAPNTPNFMAANNLPGGGLNNYRQLSALNKDLATKFNVNNLIKSYSEYQFYIDNKKIDSAALNKTDVENYLVQLLLKKPEVIYAFSYTNFDKTILLLNLKEKFINGYYPKRSGDVQIILKAQYTEGLPTGTDHGVGYAYDTHIPLLWYGYGIKPGKTNRETYMTDIAPTLAAMLQLQMPSGSVGKVLGEIVE